jgi:hypothetical protein
MPKYSIEFSYKLPFEGEIEIYANDINDAEEKATEEAKNYEFGMTDLAIGTIKEIT